MEGLAVCRVPEAGEYDFFRGAGVDGEAYGAPFLDVLAAGGVLFNDASRRGVLVIDGVDDLDVQAFVAGDFPRFFRRESAEVGDEDGDAVVGVVVQPLQYAKTDACDEQRRNKQVNDSKFDFFCYVFHGCFDIPCKNSGVFLIIYAFIS